MNAVFAAVAYVAAIVTANVATARYGMVPVGFGLTATAGTYAAGLAFGARDLIQETGGRRAVIAAIALGATLSWWLATPALAVASTAAFAIAETADWAIYTPLRRQGWARAVVASNVVGAVIDTIVFLFLAGFPLTVAAVSGQLVGKILWATLIPVLVISVARRAVLREPLDAAGA